MKPHLCYATEIRSPRSEVTKTWGWTSSEACHQMDLKFEDRPDVIWGETACLGYAASYLLWRNQGSHFLSHIQYWYIDIDITYYVSFNDHPRTRRGQSAGCYSYCPGLLDFSSFMFCSYCKTVEQTMQRSFIYLEVLPPLAV